MSNPANDDFSQHLSDDEESNHEDASDTGAAPKQQQQMIPQTTAISNIKLPILKKEEYDIWAMEMEHYLEYIDNEVWKVIQNGNSKKRISTGKREDYSNSRGYVACLCNLLWKGLALSRSKVSSPRLLGERLEEVNSLVGDKVMLKVLPWKGVVHFGKRGKLNPRYVGPFKVFKKVGSVVYKLELPQELNRVHNTFHVSNLKKCYADEPLVVPLDGLHFDDKLQFVKELVEIMDREVKWSKRIRIPLVKV
ncbi:hypothetical protein Tco_0580906 [Tanacetum coccineum]